MSAVPAIQLLLFLPPGQPHLLRVHDDDVVPHVQERRVARLVLALQQPRRGRCNAPENLGVGVDHVPGALVIGVGRYESCHLVGC